MVMVMRGSMYVHMYDEDIMHKLQETTGYEIEFLLLLMICFSD